jgi:hypothetical protein
VFDPGDDWGDEPSIAWGRRLALPSYRTASDYRRTREMSIDRKARPASYGIWRASESGMIRRFEQAGVICKRVMIDPSELALFAAHNGMAVDSACRLAFAEWTMRAETGLDAGAGERDFPKNNSHSLIRGAFNSYKDDVGFGGLDGKSRRLRSTRCMENELAFSGSTLSTRNTRRHVSSAR